MQGKAHLTKMDSWRRPLAKRNYAHGKNRHYHSGLRRERHVDGAVVHTHTVKRGAGMVRQEQEREITPAEFDAAWPRTAGARIAKHRYEVRVGEHLWVVDEFKGRDLVLAEVEMPRPDENPAVPVWLAPFIDRDVTNDPAFRNFALARQLAGES